MVDSPAYESRDQLIPMAHPQVLARPDRSWAKLTYLSEQTLQRRWPLGSQVEVKAPKGKPRWMVLWDRNVVEKLQPGTGVPKNCLVYYILLL